MERYELSLVCQLSRQAKKTLVSMESRAALGRAWSAYLDLLLDQKFEDGFPVLQYILATNSDLARRLDKALGN